MPRRPGRPAEDASPLRRARLARNWTLEAVAEEIDLRTPGGHSGVTPSCLFAHQDEGLATRGCLVVTGSRSRNTEYLKTIEVVLAEKPSLVHYRVLFGPPRNQVLKDHLIRLLELCDPRDRSLGIKTLHLGLVDDLEGAPERFFCASERMAVVPRRGTPE